MTRFVETRSKYAAQRTLFGYVKTRAGTRYALLFEDKTFSHSVDIAKWEIYLACLADLSVHAAARVAASGNAGAGTAENLARHLLRESLRQEDIPAARPQGFDDVIAKFEDRLPGVDWIASAEGETAFQPSLDALLHWAPVADELKQYDTVPVKNSLRFHWKRVRDELTSLLDPAAT